MTKVGEDGKHRVMEAVSVDGKEWTKNGVILDLGLEGSWDCGGVGSPSVIRYVNMDERGSLGQRKRFKENFESSLDISRYLAQNG